MVTPSLLAVTFDARDVVRVAQFWAGVLSREVVDEADGLFLPGDHTQLGLRFVANRTEKTEPNRMHLHLTSTSPVDQQHTVETALGSAPTISTSDKALRTGTSSWATPRTTRSA